MFKTLDTMPKGRGRGGSGHKGQRRHFTNPDQLAENKEKEERERKWREQRGEISSEESEGEESSSSESEEEEEAAETSDEPKVKGVHHLIAIENPNRVVKKDKKVSQLQVVDAEGPQLSRREREEIEKQKAKAHYQRLHAAGRTTEAKEDLARLAIIRKQREEAAKRREEEQKVKQKAEAAKVDATKKALGKKT